MIALALVYWIVGLLIMWRRLPGMLRFKPHCRPDDTFERVLICAFLVVCALLWPIPICRPYRT